MTQQSLFFEDIYEALRTDIMALGGPKNVGHMLWPDKPADKAGELLNNCLNRTRNEKLDPEQVQFIKREARKRGSFATAYFCCDDAGFARPQPLEPEDEAAKLQRKFIAATAEMRELMVKLERLQGGDK